MLASESGGLTTVDASSKSGSGGEAAPAVTAGGNGEWKRGESKIWMDE